MKQKIICVLFLLSILSLTACSRRSFINEHSDGGDTTASVAPDGFEDVTAPPKEDTSAEAVTENTEREEALNAAKALVGDTDGESGLKYTFSYDGEDTVNGKTVSRVRVSVHGDDGTYTVCGTVLVDEYGNAEKYEW